jgi:hypothetical protein
MVHFMSRFLWAISYFALVYKVAVQYLFIQVVLQKERFVHVFSPHELTDGTVWM